MKKSGQRRTIQYKTHTFSYELIFSKRRTLGLHIYADGRMIVRAPTGSALDYIESFLLSRGDWILRHQRKFKEAGQQPARKRKYADGELYYYLGKSYPLCLVQNAIEHVELRDGQLIVYAQKPADSKNTAALIDKWYRKQAARVLKERLAVCFKQVEAWGVAYPPLTIRTMTSRWGSCRSNGKITLNLRLMQVPVELIDYIVLHELCHLREMNHSKRFYALMDSVLPDWREKRERLKKTPTY